MPCRLPQDLQPDPKTTQFRKRQWVWLPCGPQILRPAQNFLHQLGMWVFFRKSHKIVRNYPTTPSYGGGGQMQQLFVWRNFGTNPIRSTTEVWIGEKNMLPACCPSGKWRGRALIQEYAEGQDQAGIGARGASTATWAQNAHLEIERTKNLVWGFVQCLIGLPQYDIEGQAHFICFQRPQHCLTGAHRQSQVFNSGFSTPDKRIQFLRAQVASRLL